MKWVASKLRLRSERILDGCNFGIATDAPGEKLEVIGNISASGDLIISDGTRTLTYDVSAGDLQHAGATFHINKSNGVDTSFDNGTLYVDASANRVSIGAGTTPSSKLDISGDMKATHITASGNISGSGGNILGFNSASFNYITASVIDLDGSTIRMGGQPYTKPNNQS